MVQVNNLSVKSAPAISAAKQVHEDCNYHGNKSHIVVK